MLLVAASLLAASCTTPPDCSPEAGFNTGLKAETTEPACEGDDYREDYREDYLEAYRIGQTLGEMRSERDSLIEREETLNPTERMRLRVLERDIPEVETLARIKGLMPQSALPGDLTDLP